MSKIKILVKRDTVGSTNPADPIVEPILTELEPALLRGRYEIDNSSLYPVSMNSIMDTSLKPSDVIAITENLFGTTIFGILSSVEFRYSSGIPSMSLEILRRK